jgi:hypothetical protein
MTLSASSGAAITNTGSTQANTSAPARTRQPDPTLSGITLGKFIDLVSSAHAHCESGLADSVEQKRPAASQPRQHYKR